MSQEQRLQPIDESVGYLLKKAATALRSAMDSALRPLDLTVPQYACLEVLQQRPGLTCSELAKAVFVTRQSMNLVLKGLAERGLLTRPSMPDHGKALPAELTPAGRERLRAATPPLRLVESKMLDAMSPGTADRLSADLAAIATALGGNDARGGEGL